MDEEKNKSKTAIVTGDITMDWNIATSQGVKSSKSYWSIDFCSRAYWQRGGAAMLADLLASLVNTLPQDHQIEIHQTGAPREEISPCDARFPHSYAMWAPHKYGEKPPLDKEKFAWRVEHFLGFDCATLADADLLSWQQVREDDPNACLLVLDDANLGFRNQPDLWPQALKKKGRQPWIVLKMAQPIAQGKLWQELISAHSERLIVITTINDLRRTTVQISRQISWERTSQDVVWELTHNPQVNALSHCAAVIISFYTAGTIFITWKEGRAQASLFFDPLIMEGDFERQHPGQMIGYSTCLAAAVAYQIMLNNAEPDFVGGIQRGIAAMRSLHLEGYGLRGSPPPQADLRFPIDRMVKIISQDNSPMSVTAIQDPTRYLLEARPALPPALKRNYWAILEEGYTDKLDSIARQIVLEGFESALRDVPVGRFNDLVTVDRREIEALHSIQRLIQEYTQTDQKRPLSIAVFGPPGSGKSFGVEQVTKSILGEVAMPTFNLSQFNDTNDLLDALHRVRDAALSGRIPLVFWDEFDTSFNGQPLGWLRYFLAPMQDGAFQQGQIMHPIGRCIFVFAGGTSHTMERFGADLSDEQKRLVKLPDFVSRLKGFLNVLGPNPIEVNGSDPYFILRRAITLRSLVERNVKGILQNKKVNIDSGVLRGLLKTHLYKHGVRSMESILAMSTLSNKTSFDRSSLPPEDQLELHVEARDFLALVQQIELEGELLERMASAAHEVFCEGLKNKGYRYASVTKEKEKTHSSLMTYDLLPENEKEQNRANVRDIAAKLNRVGYVMRPARSNEPAFDFPGDDLEDLAEREHERYVRQKLSAGWKYAPKTDKTKKLNSTLVDWSQLSDAEKEKDRTMVRGIPTILAKAGYAIEKINIRS
jgi:hypothetical protein